jgi:hypothetical protein
MRERHLSRPLRGSKLPEGGRLFILLTSLNAQPGTVRMAWLLIAYGSPEN